MKLKKRTALSLVMLLTLVVGLVAGPFMSSKVEAGTLTSAYLYLDDISVNQSSGLEVILELEVSQTIPSGGTVTITFPAGSGEWCKTAGAMGNVAGVSSSAVGTIDTALPTTGTLAATCTQHANGDYVTITAVDTLSTGNYYGVSFDDSGVGVLGTPTTSASGEPITVTAANGQTIDTMTFEIDLVADGTVQVDVDVASAATITCELDSTTVDLGTVYPGGAYQTDSIELTVSTSGTSGFYWSAFGTGSGAAAGMYSSGQSNLIPSSSSTVNLATQDANGAFGIRVDNETQGAVPSDFDNGTFTTMGGIQYGFSGARMIWSDSTDASSDTADVSFGVRAGTSTPAATDYQEIVTFQCGAYY